ncbi:DinB family protein [bacterium SCSIO 12741]|nr:DinB family protein [bacterium SCSIO 12741]
MRKYRTNGAVGALLDEYEKALNELFTVIADLSSSELTQIIDPDTKDADCHSIQTILTHLVQSGYTYAVEIRKWQGEDEDYRDKETLSSVQEYRAALWIMFQFTEKLFEDHPNLKLTEYDNAKKIQVRWGQTFDVEQLMQHAIVHILRHRRQIEKFKLLLG